MQILHVVKGDLPGYRAGSSSRGIAVSHQVGILSPDQSGEFVGFGLITIIHKAGVGQVNPSCSSPSSSPKP